MQEITPAELKQKLDAGEEIQLIDVREPYEYEIANLNGELIPMAIVMESADKFARDKPVIVYCRSGNRSATAIHNLEKRYGFTNLYNLKGGILAYARDVDQSLAPY